MDSREILVIGVIKDVPYRLVAFQDKEFVMSIVIVDTPPNYGMVFSMKWSAFMGGRMECDMSFSRFPIDGKTLSL